MRSLFARIAIGFICLIVIACAAMLGWPEKSYERFDPDDSYLAQAANYNVPPMPEDWVQAMFTASDGTKLRWGQTGNAASAKATVVLIPGYTATLTMYGEHVDDLARRGFHVMGIDMRGQGQSERHRPDYPEKLWVEDFSRYSDDLAEFLALQAPTDKPVIIAGSSFGGHVALRHAVDHPGQADGLFLIAPAIKPRSGDIEYEDAYRVMTLARWLGKSERYIIGGSDWRTTHEDLTQASIEHCASNPDRLHARDVIFTRNPAERVGDPTNQWAAEFYESVQYLDSQVKLNRVSVPVTMIMADFETFVENEEISRACSRLIDCETVQIPETGHCLLQESDDVLNNMYDEVDTLVDRISERYKLSTHAESG